MTHPRYLIGPTLRAANLQVSGEDEERGGRVKPVLLWDNRRRIFVLQRGVMNIGVMIGTAYVDGRSDTLTTSHRCNTFIWGFSEGMLLTCPTSLQDDLDRSDDSMTRAMDVACIGISIITSWVSHRPYVLEVMPASYIRAIRT
jgi:hypothetical protein